MNVKVRILVEHRKIGAFASATHSESYGALDRLVIVERVFPEHASPSQHPHSSSLEELLNLWQKNKYITDGDKILLYSKILAIEITPIEEKHE